MTAFGKAVEAAYDRRRRRGKPYEPIVTVEQLLQADIAMRAWTPRDERLLAPDLFCKSSRRQGFTDEWPLFTPDDGPAIRVPRMQARGLCILCSPGWEDRHKFFCHVLVNDAEEREVGIHIIATPDLVGIGDPRYLIPELSTLVAAFPGSSTVEDGFVRIREPTATRAASRRRTNTLRRPRLGLALEWALEHQQMLSDRGIVSLVVAEGHTVVPQLLDFIDGWTSGPLAVAVGIDPAGEPDAPMTRLLGLARTVFLACPFQAIDRHAIVDTKRAKTLKASISKADSAKVADDSARLWRILGPAVRELGIRVRAEQTPLNDRLG